MTNRPARAILRPRRPTGESVAVASLCAVLGVAGLALKVSSAMAGLSVGDVLWGPRRPSRRRH